MELLVKIFVVFFKIGAFSFGGGNAILPLIRQEVIVNNKWIGYNEFTDLVAISQATPGPVAINSATYIGYKVAGIQGSLLATLGVSLPTFLIMLTLTHYFFRFRENQYVKDAFLGLVPATVGLVAAAAIMLVPSSFIDYKSVLIFAAVFVASYKYKIDPIILILVTGLLGYLIYN
jgi:chromate transporter